MSLIAVVSAFILKSVWRAFIREERWIEKGCDEIQFNNNNNNNNNSNNAIPVKGHIHTVHKYILLLHYRLLLDYLDQYNEMCHFLKPMKHHIDKSVQKNLPHIHKYHICMFLVDCIWDSLGMLYNYIHTCIRGRVLLHQNQQYWL